MKDFLILCVFLVFYGCAGIAENQEDFVLQHESNEERLLTKEEFFARVSKSVDLIYEGMSAVREAVNLYAKDNNGALPSGSDEALKRALVEGGYLEKWPVVPFFALKDPVQRYIRYYTDFADADNNGMTEDAIFLDDLKIEVCQEFVHRYASPGFGDEVYDYEAAGEQYPAATIGRHIKIFAVNWSASRAPDSCSILWFIEYTGIPTAKLSADH